MSILSISKASSRGHEEPALSEVEGILRETDMDPDSAVVPLRAILQEDAGVGSEFRAEPPRKRPVQS